MKLRLDRLPVSLQDRREMLGRCLLAMNQVRDVHAVYLFGSHVRGEAGPGSDVDLCIVADGEGVWAAGLLAENRNRFHCQEKSRSGLSGGQTT